MVEKWEITIPELSGDEVRRVYVYLPVGYDDDEDAYYPVLYMFDGHNVFFDEDATYGKSWGMAEYMDYTETPMIIAAVECTHDPDNGRLKEYSPYTFNDRHFGYIKGIGRSTMNWYINSLKRGIDENFRTIPDREHTFIAGSSMGGLMSLYALIKYNNVFSRAAALSPSVWTASDKLVHLIENANLDPYTILYMDYGEYELPNHSRMNDQLMNIVSALVRRHVLLDFRVVPGGTHSEESWEMQAPFFMDTLTYRLYED